MAGSVHFYEKVTMFMMLYLVQGIPFGFQDRYLPVYYRSKGLSYTSLSLLRIVFIPWLIKVVWAPFVDNMKSKPKCIITCMVMMMVCNFIAFAIDPEDVSKFAGSMLLMNIFASVHDVAVDTFAISNLSNEELGKGNTAQVVGYKAGMVIGGGGVLYISQHWGHSSIFLAMNLLIFMVMVAFITFLTQYEPVEKLSTPVKEPLPEDETTTVHSFSQSKEQVRLRKLAAGSENANPKHPMALSESYSDPLYDNRPIAREQQVYSYFDILHTSGTLWTLCFVLVYKLGESGALALFPLFLLDAGLKPVKVHLWQTVVGQITSILGSIVGGIYASNTQLICKYLTIMCVVRSVIMFGMREFVINTNITIDEERDAKMLMAGFFCLTALNFVSGAMTTVTFTHMMVVSQKAPAKHQALHYSFLATAEVLGKFLLGVAMGPVIDQYGEDVAITVYFALSLIMFPLLGIRNLYFSEKSLKV